MKSIKYSDKSYGQPEMIRIFNDLSMMLAPYEKGAIKKIGGDSGQVSYVSVKGLEIAGRKQLELCFASVLIQKGYVGFYFMPVYVHPEIKAEIGEELLKTLKGKSCFHIKSANPVIYRQIQDALAGAYEAWKEKGWV